MSDSTHNPATSSDSIESKFDRIDLLVSLLVDEVISGDQFEELEGLLGSDEEMRTRYVRGVQLHCDLVEHYRPQQQADVPSSPVLTMLADTDESGIHLGVQPPKK